MILALLLGLCGKAAAIHVPTAGCASIPPQTTLSLSSTGAKSGVRLRGGGETISPSAAPEPPVVDLHASTLSTPLLVLLPVAYLIIGVAVYGTVLENQGKDGWTLTDCLYFVSASMSTGESLCPLTEKGV